MSQSAFLMPILPGKVDDCRAYWQELAGPKAAELCRQHAAAGITKLVASIQTSPVGPVLVQYIESNQELSKLLDKDAGDKSDFEQWVEQRFQEFSGKDWKDASNFPQSSLDYSVDHDDLPGTARPMLFALPIVDPAAYQAFLDGARGERKAGADQYQRSLGTKKWVAVQQQSEGKRYLIQYWETTMDPSVALGSIPGLDTDTERWIVDSYRAFTGIDSTQTQPDYEVVFDWSGATVSQQA